LVPAGLLTSFTGFEALTLDMAGARVVLPGTFAAAVGAGVFTVDLNTTAGTPGSAFRAHAVSNRLDIFGDVGVEGILAGRGADTIRDGESADRIQGHLGADRIILSADGAADRIAFGNFFDGSLDIAAPSNQGTLAQADTITGFAGAGDPDNLLEFTRAASAPSRRSSASRRVRISTSARPAPSSSMWPIRSPAASPTAPRSTQPSATGCWAAMPGTGPSSSRAGRAAPMPRSTT
jgi:hypothetical protein